MSSHLPAVVVPAFIPSPSQGVWHLGPLPLRAYAICILIGIFAGYWLGRKRWVARGGAPEVLADIIMWAVPFGLVGARIYHVITDSELYFGPGKHPIDALKIWHGGLGIWGAVAFGALGAWIACRRHKVPFLAVADAMAPGIALAQVVGRFGNYFNQELFGRPTTLPWGLEIDLAHRPDGYTQYATFHPTFLYEAIWNLGVIALVILAGRRFKLGHGRAFALYVAGYTAGRAWIENLRIDTVNHFLGLRLNVWTALILFVASVVYLVLSARLKPGQEDISTPSSDKPADDADSAKAPADETSASAESTVKDDSAAAADSTEKADSSPVSEADSAEDTKVEAKVGASPTSESATSASPEPGTATGASPEPATAATGSPEPPTAATGPTDAASAPAGDQAKPESAESGSPADGSRD
jgi:prolipoprotein diacylglyceryl transferase